jgi:hypothetical protein
MNDIKINNRQKTLPISYTFSLYPMTTFIWKGCIKNKVLHNRQHASLFFNIATHNLPDKKFMKILCRIVFGDDVLHQEIIFFQKISI